MALINPANLSVQLELLCHRIFLRHNTSPDGSGSLEILCVKSNELSRVEPGLRFRSQGNTRAQVYSSYALIGKSTAGVLGQAR